MTDYEKEQYLNNEVFNGAIANAGSVKPTYAGTFEDQLKDIYGRIANREPFSYDINADPLYDLYKDKYIQGGKLAMKDTMGQAAGLTGGYGTSYGQQVGQQAYDAYLQNLSDVIPELYGMAYDKYKDEGDNLLNLYGMAGDMRDNEYSKYRDELSDYNYNQEVQREMEDLLYNRRINEDNTAWSRQNTEQQQAWERQQKAYSNLASLISTTAYQPTDAELEAAGMYRGEADALWAQALREWAVKMDQIYGTGSSSSSSGSSGGSSGGGGGGGYTYSDETLSIQRQLNAMGAGIAEDGLWGQETQTAYDKYMGGGRGGYTLNNLADDVAAVNQNGRATYGQVSAVVEAYREAAQTGNANYTEAELNKYVSDNHLPDEKSSNKTHYSSSR